MLSAQHMPAQTTMLHARPPQQPCPQHTQLVPTHTPSYQAPAALQINLLSLGHQANTADMPSCDTNHALRSAYHPFLCTSCSTHTHVQHDRGSHYCCQGKQAVSLFSCAACTATASCLHTQCDSPHHQQHFFSCLASAPQQTVLTLGNPQPIPKPSNPNPPDDHCTNNATAPSLPETAKQACSFRVGSQCLLTTQRSAPVLHKHPQLLRAWEHDSRRRRKEQMQY
jgi:hypothetical protein